MADNVRVLLVVAVMVGLGSTARATDDPWAVPADSTAPTTPRDPADPAAPSPAVLAEEAEFVASRAFSVYGAVIDNRGPFERLYDSMGHVGLSVLRTSYDDLVAAKRALHAALDARDTVEASQQLIKMKSAAKRIDYNLEVYKKASKDGAQNLMIFTFVLAALVTCLVVWLVVKRKRKRMQPAPHA